MSLTKSDGQNWSGEVSLSKYQFSQSSKFDPKFVYGSISENIEFNKSVMDFLKTKFINNVFENTDNVPSP